MAQILRNNIIIGTAAIKDLVVSDNSKTQQTVKFVRTVDQYENIDISYDTFKEFEYGEVVIDNVLYGDIPASGGSISPLISYHQTIIYKGYSGLRYLQDVEGGFIALKPQYNYVGEYVEGMFVKYNDILTYQGKYYRCINRAGTSEKPFDGEVPPNNEGLNGNYKEVGGPDTITDMGDWYSGIYVGYNQTVRMYNQIFKCVNPNGSFESPLYRYNTNSGQYLTLGNGLGGGYIVTGESNPDFVKIQDDITEGAVITFSGNIVDENGTVRAESLGTTSKPRSVIDTVTVTVSLNGKTATKTVSVYQSENTAVANYYNDPEITNKFSYDVFGAVRAESVVPSVAPKYTQTKITRYSSGEVLYTNVSTGGVFKFTEIENPMGFTIVDDSTGAISTVSRTVPGNIYGKVSVTVTLNGKTSPSQTIQICQEGVQRWHNGNVYTPRDIVSMGLDKNEKDRLFIPLAETTSPPLSVFRTFENDALKFSGSNEDGYVLTGKMNTEEYMEFFTEWVDTSLGGIFSYEDIIGNSAIDINSPGDNISDVLKIGTMNSSPQTNQIRKTVLFFDLANDSVEFEVSLKYMSSCEGNNYDIFRIGTLDKSYGYTTSVEVKNSSESFAAESTDNTEWQGPLIFSIKGRGRHFIEIYYATDISAAQGEDCGKVYISSFRKRNI